MQYKNIIVAIVILLSATACNNNHTEKKTAHATDSLQQKKVTFYTCPMHHNVRETAPGKCPICGMTLIPVEPTPSPPKMDSMDSMGSMKSMTMLTIPPREQMLAGIQTDTAKILPFSNEKILIGTTIFNPQNQNVVSAWVSGWIEKMYIRNPGEKVEVGEKLYDIYSPDLLSAENDYVLTLKQKNIFKEASVDLTATIDAMRQKLLRLGLSQKQIESLPNEKPTGKIPIYSKYSGFLVQEMKEEGDFVNEGDAIFNLVANNTLWVQAQLYDNEISTLNSNNKISVSINNLSAKRIPGEIVFDNPVNQNNSRVQLLNISIANTNGSIQPGMLAYVYLQTGDAKNALVVPKSAIVYGEKNDYVWVALPYNKYERRKVQVGNDNQTMVQILEGLKAGENIVSAGTYLVNSEYELKYGTGVNLSGMQMSDMKMSGKSK